MMTYRAAIDMLQDLQEPFSNDPEKIARDMMASKAIDIIKSLAVTYNIPCDEPIGFDLLMKDKRRMDWLEENHPNINRGIIDAVIDEDVS
ncbi:MAG: hypothetical protein PVG39_30780 [Desulfobacteraceae bacterium]|jgi:hypothetical protein